ncbi:hypothetical protein PIROE2DRAFT_16738 [Piromyces sp. E2]|nr:hypothetical protein PIROE2DRAFT_16738 [Piromyces sp. E2]|eukprot:OUM58091.1 hypothetical protein PIROE2DRAFT_16738 [Piromyces sp. E2]
MESYFDSIGENEAQKSFPLIYPQKENIILNVIYNKETRKNMTQLGKEYDLQQLIPKLLKNKDVGNMIMKGILEDGNAIMKAITNISKQFGTNIFNTLLENPQSLKMIMNGKLNDENCNSLINENNNKSDDNDDNDIIKFIKNIRNDDDNDNDNGNNNNNNNNNNNYNNNDDNNSNNNSLVSGPFIVSNELNNNGSINDDYNVNTNDNNIHDTFTLTTTNNNKIGIVFSSKINNNERRNFIELYQCYNDFSTNENTGYSGEAHIYEFLENLRISGQLKSVEWKSLSKNGYGTLIKYKGKSYWINSDGSHYDFVVETNNSRKIYIEVKSIKYPYNGKKIPFYLSQLQIEEMNSIKYPNEYVLAVVFDVYKSTQHYFLNLRNNIITNRICDDENHKYLIELEKNCGKEYFMKILHNTVYDTVYDNNYDNINNTEFDEIMTENEVNNNNDNN